MIDEKTIRDHNLTPEEYGQIVRLVGRDLNITELGIFSVMWSEHCSYKSSRVHLKKLPTQGRGVIQGPGENAGVIDIGDGLAVVFKIESHNHPSFIEPFQGAATGVGGILRDIFTMGARPIALLDSLRFGLLTKAQNRAIMEGVVSGISSYGNSIGVPTVGGEVYFDDVYSLNPLVNVFCLGIAEKDKVFYARAGEAGNAVLYVGSKTGRDGIHGATMASAEFGEQTEHKRPNVQVGDPFKEKLLLEACLDVMNRNLIVGIQDMGAAGLTCSTTEIAAKSRKGIAIDLDLVPQREEGMTAYEIMLSESQERMLIVAEPGKVAEVQEAFARWDLDAIRIGEVREGGRIVVRFRGEVVVDVPVEAVVDLCPAYNRKSVEPTAAKGATGFEWPPLLPDYNDALLRTIASPTLADKEWIFRQYDHMVLVNTVLLPGSDAAVLRIKGGKKALAVTLDGNGFYASQDPRNGAKIAVSEACRNLSCVGAEPVGVTNCLNFGNPEKPEVMWQFVESVEGMAEACRAFSIPVTGGNVSFYNDTEGLSIFPTPVLGVVGLIEDISGLLSPFFKKEGDFVVLLGTNEEELGVSEYLRAVFGRKSGFPPKIDLEEEKRIQGLCREANSLRLLQSAHDISDGGLAVSLAECCFLGPRRTGCLIDLQDGIRNDALLFGETQSRIIVTAAEDDLQALLALARKRRATASVIGRVGGDSVVIRRRGEELINLATVKVHRAWKSSIPSFYER